jgi:hypothetical protein
MMNSVGSLGLVGALVFGLLPLGCGGSAVGPSGGNEGGIGSDSALAQRCTPGQQIACACPGTTVTGAQSCNSDGQGYGSCDCLSGDASGGLQDGAADVTPGHDGAANADTGAAGAFDGTSGKACATDADCRGASGPGVNVCSNTLVYTSGGSTFNALPTPVCMVAPGGSTGNCDPAPASDPTAQLPHFCDGPDSPTSPGICLMNSPAAPHAGSCTPQCTFRLDGSAPIGCAGHDTCVETQFIGLDPNSSLLLGWGFCQGTCQADSDCAGVGTGMRCQLDTGFCTATLVHRTKPIGQACTPTDSDTGACNCFAPTGSGYCTSACVIGGAPCPNGWACDTLQSATVSVGGTDFSVTAENTGMSGLCVAPCTAPDGGTLQCPGTTTCQTGTPLGANCLP